MFELQPNESNRVPTKLNTFCLNLYFDSLSKNSLFQSVLKDNNSGGKYNDR